MKQMTFTVEEDGSIFLQTKGNITFREITRIAAALMAKSVIIGLQRGVIYESEIEDFFQQTITAARLTLAAERKEE